MWTSAASARDDGAARWRRRRGGVSMSLLRQYGSACSRARSSDADEADAVDAGADWRRRRLHDRHRHSSMSATGGSLIFSLLLRFSFSLKLFFLVFL